MKNTKVQKYLVHLGLLLGVTLPLSIILSNYLFILLMIGAILLSKRREKIAWFPMSLMALPVLVPLLSLMYHGQNFDPVQLEVRVPFLVTTAIFGIFNIDPEQFKGIKIGLVFGALLSGILLILNSSLLDINLAGTNWLDFSYIPLFLVVGIIIIWYTDVTIQNTAKIFITLALMVILLLLADVFFIVFGFLIATSALVVKGSRLQSKITVMIIVLVTALVLYKGSEINTIFQEQQISESTPKNKLAQWQCALEIMNGQEFLGVGYGNKKSLLLDCYHNHNMTEAELSQFNAHNEYLDFFLSFGYIGVLALVVYLINAMFLAYDNKQVALLLIIILLSLFALNENIFTRQKGVMLTSITYLLIYANAKFSPSRISDSEEDIAVV